MSKKIKVGFDLDGVLLYNPARIVRPLVSLLKKKKVLIERKELEFYVPKTSWEQWFWELFHKSSIFLSPGFAELVQLQKKGVIEPYLITGRFGHLQGDCLKWLKKMNAKKIFVGCFINKNDEQPHLFKEKMVKKLKLDYFIEDNWDIVRHLDQTCRLNVIQNGQNHKVTQVIWVSNVLDFRIPYYLKVTSLSQALSVIEKLTA